MRYILQYERVVKNLKDKLKRIQGHAMSEVEHLKYKLIMERHEREKEQTEHSTLTKYLSNHISLTLGVNILNLIKNTITENCIKKSTTSRRQGNT